ncbi:MAG: hypothetical protein QXI12_03575 [Candidatus Methanomethyliaceae archaeon]
MEESHGGGRARGTRRQTASRSAFSAHSGAKGGVGPHSLARTSGGGVLHRPLDANEDQPGDREALRREVPPGARLAHPAGDGLECPEAGAKGARTR